MLFAITDINIDKFDIEIDFPSTVTKTISAQGPSSRRSGAFSHVTWPSSCHRFVNDQLFFCWANSTRGISLHLQYVIYMAMGPRSSRAATGKHLFFQRLFPGSGLSLWVSHDAELLAFSGARSAFSRVRGKALQSWHDGNVMCSNRRSVVE